MITEKDLKTLFTSDEIQNAIKELGVRINSDYGDDELFLICVLKGAVMFTVDLSKHLKMPVQVLPQLAKLMLWIFLCRI